MYQAPQHPTQGGSGAGANLSKILNTTRNETTLPVPGKAGYSHGSPHHSYRDESLMAHIIIQHRVADFDTWRPVYEADQPGCKGAGVTDIAILRDADDPNSVWIVHDGDPALVGPMMSDPERTAKMQEAGVTSPPTVYVADVAS